MDAVLARPPLTSIRAKSAGPSRLHRDHMEDADPDSTRKRPRLDSGERAYRSMSADRLNATLSDARHAEAPRTPIREEDSTKSVEPISARPSTGVTPSKVTINVREPAGNISPSRLPDLTNGVSTLPSMRGGGEAFSSQNNSPRKMGSPSSNVVSIHSSPRRSPEIEVAEIEDINDDQVETRWKPLGSTTNAEEAKGVQEAMLLAFPFVGDRGRSLRKTIPVLAQALEKGDLEDGRILSELAGWLETYLQATESHVSQWRDMYLEEKDFWDSLPSLPEALLRRTNTRLANIKMVDSSVDEASTSPNSLHSFLVAYTAVALRMVLIDLQWLKKHGRDVTTSPELVSQSYLVCLLTLMRHGLLFWKSLVDPVQYDVKATITAMVDRFTIPSSDGIKCMTQMAEELLERSQNAPVFLSKVWPQINIVTSLMQHHRLLQDGDLEAHVELPLLMDELPAQAYEFFLAVDERFRTLISKQIFALSIEICQGLISHLSLLFQLIVQSDDRLTYNIINESQVLVPGLTKEDNAVLAELAWKFDLLKRCILEGRMEIRVQGVETMQQELVNIYTQYIQNTSAGKDHPIVQYFSDFMLKNRLVEYFVGVESHPQLISRCANIVGFLIVAFRYTNAESDVIWRAVTTSQDSRFVEAILNMLHGIFNIATYPIVLYLAVKLNELPVQAFDVKMIQYSRTLLDYLRQKWRTSPNDQHMDMPPYHLCIRLIRQSTADSSLDSQKRREIHHFATTELRHLLPFGPGDAERSSIYRECIEDISDRSEFATGSVSAINILLTQQTEKDIALLAKESDFTPLVVKEFAQMIETERSSGLLSIMLDERLNYRLNLLQQIIGCVPDTITTEVGAQLWDIAVGPQALNDNARELGWMCFIRVIRYTPSRNAFIDRCIKEYLPRLLPRFYTLGCLTFVQDVVNYHSRLTPQTLGDDSTEVSPAWELLWQLALTAPVGTVLNIEQRAISILVNLYLESPDVQRRTDAATEAIHIEVVERCISQLTSAASKLRAFSDGTSSGEDEPMIIVASEDEVQGQRLSFSRSLLILKELVHRARASPRYSPRSQHRPQIPPNISQTIRGNGIDVRYQAFGDGSSTDIHTIEVGDLETVKDLSNRLMVLTGFPKFTAITGGKVLDMTSLADHTLRDLKFEQKGLLLIKKAADTESALAQSPVPELQPLELEIMTHFPELHQLLGMEEKLAREVYEFLIAFPPHSSVTALVCSKDTPLEMIFPSAAPFKILYSVHALKLHLVHQTRIGAGTRELVCFGIRSLSSTLTSFNMGVSSHSTEVDITVAYGLTDCLLAFLKEPINSAESLPDVSNPAALVDRLYSLIPEALDIIDNGEAEALACGCFAVLLRASLRWEQFWNCFKNTDVCSVLLRRLLLEEPRWPIRQSAAEQVRSTCRSLTSNKRVPALDFIHLFWQKTMAVMPSCLAYGGSTQQFFEVAVTLCHSTDHAYRDTLDLSTYASNWSDLLLQHIHDEFPGRESIDWLVWGLSSLVHWCFQVSKSLSKPLLAPTNLLEKLFRAHLYPEIPDTNDGVRLTTPVPNLQSSTREELYSIILVLSNDIGGYQKLLMLVRDLLSQGEDSQAWSWGIAQMSEEYTYDVNWNFERTKCIRSATGYPGLRNLSNTCYMNSLFTQLFMNVRFREFILSTNIADGIASQRLLYETQSLFAYMQNSMLKSVDPQGIADSLVTYDNALIDISIQMDVDEFYNLLFDRWESQILASADKTKFRAFYGGQIVQQIKSKECPHISERLEPFSAIQCDIQGKISLIDSLNAYVDGEVMEGDNKYSCTSCGCYVDAVKRACFKDIPNNLIFHLKRFDYDVMTGMRSKINEHFEFPEQIDMTPYHVDDLSDSQEPSSPDLFELVGVLVHSGTAESGHYYSYIKERPPTSPNGKTWVEFNDADVTSFDPSNIPDQCFGGMSNHTGYANRYHKSWNAYMLFYERINANAPIHCNLPSTSVGVPAKIEVPIEFENRIAVHNAKWLRTYCLFDPAHAAFARGLLEQLRYVNRGTCSEDHTVEQEAIWLSLDQLDRILSRAKDCPDFGKMLASLTKVIGACSTCCKLALEWVSSHELALRNLLIRCPTPKVRKDFASMIIVALRYLRKNEPGWYGFEDAEEIDIDSSSKEMRLDGAIFSGILRSLKDLWSFLPTQLRGWDDYFGLLTEMALFGAHEVHVLLNAGILQGCLELLIVEQPHRTSRIRIDRPEYLAFIRHCEKGRKFSMGKLIELVAVLLSKIDLKVSPVRRFQERRLAANMRLTKIEDEYMHLGGDLPRSKSCCIFLEKILNTGSNAPAAKKIVQAMTLAEPDFSMLEPVQKTITTGVNVEPAAQAIPFLRAALTFCECTPSLATAQQVIQHIAGEVDTIGHSGGREHLDFFTQARRLANPRHNIRSASPFQRYVLRAVPQWAPALLMYWDETVRNGTIDLLKILVFGRDIRSMDDEQEADLIETAGRDLCRACTRRCSSIVQQQKQVDGKVVEQVILIIKHCLSVYWTADDDQKAVVEAESILGSLEALTVSDVDEAASENWNNASDEMPSDSDSDPETFVSS